MPYPKSMSDSSYSYFYYQKEDDKMESIQTMASELLVNLALGVLTLLGAYAMYYIRIGVSMRKMKTAAIKDEAARKLLNDALDDVESLATVSVSAMEQTTAKALRDAVKAGTVDREELLKLGKEVFEDVKKSITPEAQRVITENLGSFDDYLIKCIEDAVRKVKQEDPYITLDRELLESGSVVTE